MRTRLRLGYVPRLLHIAASPELTGTPPHQHASWTIIIYLTGRGEVAFDDRRVPFAVGTTVCVPPRTRYAEIPVERFRSLYLLATGLDAGATDALLIGER